MFRVKCTHCWSMSTHCLRLHCALTLRTMKTLSFSSWSISCLSKLSVTPIWDKLARHPNSLMSLIVLTCHSTALRFFKGSKLPLKQARMDWPWWLTRFLSSNRQLAACHESGHCSKILGTMISGSSESRTNSGVSLWLLTGATKDNILSMMLCLQWLQQVVSLIIKDPKSVWQSTFLRLTKSQWQTTDSHYLRLGWQTKASICPLSSVYLTGSLTI